ncbi:MAG: hypothetical protein NXI04_16770 [Planctomycetaceae bacterium]|nr:hypothetical protein [Planctomycetaceae bacterium]
MLTAKAANERFRRGCCMLAAFFTQLMMVQRISTDQRQQSQHRCDAA